MQDGKISAKHFFANLLLAKGLTGGNNYVISGDASSEKA